MNNRNKLGQVLRIGFGIGFLDQVSESVSESVFRIGFRNRYSEFGFLTFHPVVLFPNYHFVCTLGQLECKGGGVL